VDPEIVKDLKETYPVLLAYDLINRSKCGNPISLNLFHGVGG
jgi:hypothetical protein